jgi:FkbM family methyltransferase
VPERTFDPAATPLFRAYRQWNEGLAWNEIILRPGLKLKICPDSRNPFEYFCYIDPEMVAEFDSFLALAKNKKRLLDVGALQGVFSMGFTAQDPSREALAVEPSPKAAPFLLYNIHANPGLKVEHVEVALSDSNTEMLMQFGWQHLTTVHPGQAPPTEDDRVIKVGCQTGDDLCAERSFCPDIIKIDIEGYEYRCLLGLRKTISKARPVICLEVHPTMRNYGDSPADLLLFFNELAYRFYDVNGAPLADEELLSLSKIVRMAVIPREASPG